MSAHLALILLAVGLWLHPSNFSVQVGIFVGAVIAGGGIPFIMPFIARRLRNLTSSTPPVAGGLVVVDGGPSILAPGTVFNLTPRTTIGRGPANTIQIQNPTLSTEHTRMLFRKGIWYVQDAGSANGTFVNDKPAHDALKARQGDIIQVGFIRFKLLASPPVPAQPTVNVGRAQPAAASVPPKEIDQLELAKRVIGMAPPAQENIPPIPPATLTIRLPQGEQHMYYITKPVVSIGRQIDNDIIVDDKRAGRYHAQIKFRPDGDFVIFDLGSTNGITINGTPHHSGTRQGLHTLRDGDHFTIGGYDFYFERR